MNETSGLDIGLKGGLDVGSRGGYQELVLTLGYYVVYRDVNKVLGSTIRGLLLYLGTPQLLLLCGGKINSY